ncbi:MAG: hypothetical protein JWR26_3887 [Pedosphaera sp.]|nr:hypothetical protein [Pedosphaera sp.]
MNFESLWKYVSDDFAGEAHSAHGPAHWKRVETNGLILAERTGADVNVVRLFALFHDSRRENDLVDDGHGARGAEFAKKLRGTFFDMDDAAFNLLHYACTWHTDQQLSDDVTIGTCWDADRLDLGRVGIIPRESFMSTSFGKEVARMGSFQPFL